MKTSFKKKTFIQVECCKCGKLPDYEDYFPLFETITEAKERIKEYDWQVHGSVAICEDCQNKN